MNGSSIGQADTRLTGFQFPTPRTAASQYQWNGRHFVNSDGQTLDVLCYDSGESNWSDELTRLHEQEAGRRHPIDETSRALAIHTVQQLCVTRDPVVLEVGCSSGFLLEDMARKLPHAAILGADYIAQPLHRLASRLTGVPILQFDLRQCPLPDQSLDVVICLNVLEHVDDHIAALKHIYRILKPGGIAHIEVPAGPALYDLYDEILMHQRRYRLGELKQLVRDCGFTMVRATHLGFFIYPAFALAKLWNRRRSKLPAKEKRTIISQQIRKTSRSAPLSLLLNLETLLGRWLSFPFGIRCVVVVGRSAGGASRIR